MSDKFTATWVSHSSISEFLKCPRAYYLKNMYKDPHTRHKITLMSPPLALGQAVHEVIESLSELPTVERFKTPLNQKFEIAWSKVSGKRGGFTDKDQEYQYKSRGQAMLKRVEDHPGPLKNLAVKIKMDLPYFWLSEEDNIILCGKIDWLEYLKETDSVHIIDFKTSKKEEDPESLQLPIYYLLVHYCQNRAVDKMSYWYLENNDKLTPKELPDLMEAHDRVLKIAKQISLARKLNRLTCPHKTGCYACRPYEAILAGKAERVGENDFNQDLYMLPQNQSDDDSGSVIL